MTYTDNNDVRDSLIAGDTTNVLASTKDCVPYSPVDLQLHGHCIRMTRTIRST